MKKTMTAPIECRCVRGLLSPYQDNELDRETRETLRAHLQTCRACRKELEQLELVTEKVKQLPELDTPANFGAVVTAKIIEQEEKKTRWFALPSFSFVYSFVFLLFLILGLWFNSKLDRSPVTGGPAPLQDVPETTMAQLLTESQQLQLIHVQDNAMELLEPGNDDDEL